MIRFKRVLMAFVLLCCLCIMPMVGGCQSVRATIKATGLVGEAVLSDLDAATMGLDERINKGVDDD